MANTDPMLGAPGSPGVEVLPDPLVGINLGGYVVTKELAAGGMGIVYEARHPEIDRRAAVKVLKPEVAQDEEWTKRFLVEARAISALNHRNIVEILNFGRTPDGRQYMMMAFLEGESLEHYIARMAPVPAAVALGIVEQILNGVAEAHKKGVVHRDLKPSNVQLLKEHSGDTLVKILDFGLARQDPVALTELSMADRKTDGSSLLAGTPEYIAPEQAQGLKVGPQADLYSLGVMLYEMLSGQLPFHDENVVKLLEKHVHDAPRPLSSLVSTLPEGLSDFVDTLLAKTPEERPSSADAARQLVSRFMKRMSVEATAVKAMPQAFVPTQKIDRVVKAGDATPLVLPQAQSSTDRALGEAFPRRRTGVTVVGVLLLLLLMLGGAYLVLRPVAEPEAVAAAPAPAPAPVVVPAMNTVPVEASPVAAAEPEQMKPFPANPADVLAPLPVVKPAARPPAVAKAVEPVKDTPPPPVTPPPMVVVLSQEDRAELESCKKDIENSYPVGETAARKRYEPGSELTQAVNALDQLRRRAKTAMAVEECRRVQKSFEAWQVKYTP